MNDSQGAFDLSVDELHDYSAAVNHFMKEWLAREPEDPILESISGQELAAGLETGLPRQGMEFDAVIQEFRDWIARYSRANGNPRYFAYVCASADPIGALADALASVMNQNVTAWRSAPAAATVERLVLSWLDELVGFNAGGHGVLTGGGSPANFNALAMALQRAAENGRDDRRQFVLYLSADTHLSLHKAGRILGIPVDNIRGIELDEARRMRSDELRKAITADRNAGLHPLMVVGSAGTANCGAIDPLDDIASIADEEQLWFHIDGAYGAPAAMTESHGWLRNAFAKADSLSLDPHKWLYAPLDIGCSLFRDADLARRTFSETAAYTTVEQTDPLEAHAFFDYGMELSRRFRALKLWMQLKFRGSNAIAARIQEDIRLREHLDASIAASDDFEAMGSDLSISCFRYRPNGMDEDTCNAFNRELLDRLLAQGRFLLSPTTLDGRFCLRICIVNFRTRREDLDELLKTLREIASTLKKDS